MFIVLEAEDGCIVMRGEETEVISKEEFVKRGYDKYNVGGWLTLVHEED